MTPNMPQPGWNVQAKPMTVNSSTTSQRPRVDEELLQRYGRVFSAVEICADAGEQEEGGGAEVGDPADEKIEGPGVIDVLRLEGDVGDEVARVVNGHDDHGEAADDVNGGYSLIAPIGILEGGILNGKLPQQF